MIKLTFSHTGWFLVQSVIIYTLGIRLFAHVTVEKQWSFSAATVVCLLACVPTVALAGEVFYRLVDYPSMVVPRIIFEWMRE